MISSQIYPFQKLDSSHGSFEKYNQHTRHPHLNEIYSNFKSLKKSMAHRLSRERTGRREKRPQDGKTNPME